VKKYFYNLFFKKYQYKKLYMTGLSHILNARINYSNIKYLSDVDYKIFSQNGEDGILDYLLYQLKIEKPKFMEIGVGDYSESNTRFIFDRCSPKGIIVDCIDDFENKVKKNIQLWRGELKIIEKFVAPNNINEIIQDNNLSKDLDIFSFDIDGIDYWVINELPKNFSKIAVLEYNSIFGPDKKVTVPKIKNFNRKEYHYSCLCFGMSLNAAIDLMKKKNFYFLGTNMFRNNAFFISNEFDKESHFKSLIIKDIKNIDEANFTESRNINGELNYLHGKNKLNKISDCKVVDLNDGNLKKIKEIYNIN